MPRPSLATMTAGQVGATAGERRRRIPLAALVLVLVLTAAACGQASEETGSSEEESGGQTQDGLAVVATTTILGDVTREVVGEAGEVTTLMPAGADPHSYEPSAQEVESMTQADVLVVNGGNLEESTQDAIDEAERAGVTVFTALDHVDTLAFEGEHDHGHEGESGEHAEGEEHAHEGEGETHAEDEGHAHEGEGETHAEDGEHAHEGEGETHAEDEEHAHEGESEKHSEGEEHAHEGEEHGHAHEAGSDDPHFWMDPTRMASVVDEMGAELADLASDDAAEGLTQRAQEYGEQLASLDEEIAETLSEVPEEQRRLLTNHDAFAYFADKYDFEVVGTIIPSVSTGAEPSAQDLEELAETVESEQVAAIFGETTQPQRLAETLAQEVGEEVEIVQLFTGSLGEEGSEADSYVGMLETNAQRISEALAS